MSDDALTSIAEKLEKLAEAMRDTLADPELDRRLVSLDRDNINEFGFDSFGYSPSYVKQVVPVATLLYRHYFRTKVYGIEHIPNTGRVMLIANHSGQLPVDAAVIALSTLLDAQEPRMVRSMVERWVPTLPFASVFLSRCGQVLGTPENCRVLLDQDELLLVFPEGAKGISKTYDKRYQLQRFGHGFMRLALEKNTPIVPVAVIGAEEQAPSLYNWKWLAKQMGAPALPITPFFPWLGPLGLLPLPVRYHLHFGEPIHFEGDANDDEGTIGRMVKQVKNRIRDLIHTGLKTRTSVFR
jgi:1-acyl-sn-glycerol-3-phosphate acyltransferase